MIPGAKKGHGSMSDIKPRYDADGYVAGVPILDADEVAWHRGQLEAAEAKVGPLHYQHKIHTALESAWQLASHPRVIETVQQILGPDVLLHNATYIIKEPATKSFVSWHQDLTYWGFSGDEQVSMWLALSPADEVSGCMRFLPGSHNWGKQNHQPTQDPDNVLLQGQTISDVDESSAVHGKLQAGEASFHHGWVMHCSTENNADDRRIGFNAQYIVPSMQQVKNEDDSAILLCGKDDYGYYREDVPASSPELDEAAFAHQRELNRRYVETAGTR